MATATAKKQTSPKAVASKATPTAKLETITPEKATLWLKQNELNRNVDDSNFDQLVREMKSENFHVTGETIIFSTEGKLLNGQHRLLAIEKSRVAQQIFVVRDIDPEAFQYIDTGRTRQASDVISIEMRKNDEMKQPTKIAAIIKFVINMKNGKRDQAVRNYSRGNSKVTNSDVLEFWRNNKDAILDSFPYGYNKHNKLVNKTVLGGMHYILKKKDYTAACFFCERVADGVNLATTHPIYLLRQRLTEDAKNRRKMSPNEKLALIIKTWNYFRKNAKPASLRLRLEEEFPKPI